MTTAKAESIMRKIRVVMTNLMPTYNFAASVDAEGFPVLMISQSVVPTLGEQNILIRVKPDGQFFKNCVETGQEGFCPHHVEAITEGLRMDEFDPGRTYTVLNALNEMKMHSALVKAGCVYRFYLRPYPFSIPAVSDFILANLIFLVNPSVYDTETAQ